MKKSICIILISLFAIVYSGKSQTPNAGTVLAGTFQTSQSSTPGSGIAALTKTNKFTHGRFFFYWGYNRSAYTKSDIRFSGNNYDFTISNVKASDNPTKTLLSYVQPMQITHSQYDYRIGFYLNDKYSISLGADHMKYHLLQQATHLTGNINSGLNAGYYNNALVLVGEDMGTNIPHDNYLCTLPNGFVPQYENYSGLNDISLELGRTDNLWTSVNKNFSFSAIENCGLGGVVTNTISRVLGVNSNSHSATVWGYHLSGFSATTGLGMQFNFFKHFFLLARVKGGLIDLPNDRTSSEGGIAKQHFGFVETMAVLGCSFNLGNK